MNSVHWFHRIKSLPFSHNLLRVSLLEFFLSSFLCKRVHAHVQIVCRTGNNSAQDEDLCNFNVFLWQPWTKCRPPEESWTYFSDTDWEWLIIPRHGNDRTATEGRLVGLSCALTDGATSLGKSRANIWKTHGRSWPRTCGNSPRMTMRPPTFFFSFSRACVAPSVHAAAAAISARDLPERNGAVMSFICGTLLTFAPRKARNWDKSRWPMECRLRRAPGCNQDVPIKATDENTCYVLRALCRGIYLRPHVVNEGLGGLWRGKVGARTSQTLYLNQYAAGWFATFFFFFFLQARS